MGFRWEQKFAEPVPLFDRLIDQEPKVKSEETPRRLLTEDEYFDSVINEIKRIISIRCPFPIYQIAGAERTILDYGIPSVTFAGLNTFTRCNRLLGVIKESIEAYEPRCVDVKVIMLKLVPEYRELVAEVRAKLIIENRMEPLSFPINLQLEKVG